MTEAASETVPSLAPLVTIARALGVRLGTFLDDSSELGPVIHRRTDSPQSATFSSQMTGKKHTCRTQATVSTTTPSSTTW